MNNDFGVCLCCENDMNRAEARRGAFDKQCGADGWHRQVRH
jgi:hypothetical protein